jgi:hypothetical protein
MLPIFLKWLLDRMKQTSRESTMIIFIFSWFMMISFPLNGIFFEYFGYASRIEFWLRLMNTILAISLTLRSLWPTPLKRMFPLFWYLTVFFTLPFFHTYLTLTYHASTLWMMHCVIAIFFVMLILPVLDALLVLAFGIFCGGLIFYAIHPEGMIYFPTYVDSYHVLFTLVEAVIVGILFSNVNVAFYEGQMMGMYELYKQILQYFPSQVVLHDTQYPLKTGMLFTPSQFLINKHLIDDIRNEYVHYLMLCFEKKVSVLTSYQDNQLYNRKQIDLQSCLNVLATSPALRALSNQVEWIFEKINSVIMIDVSLFHTFIVIHLYERIHLMHVQNAFEKLQVHCKMSNKKIIFQIDVTSCSGTVLPKSEPLTDIMAIFMDIQSLVDKMMFNMIEYEGGKIIFDTTDKDWSRLVIILPVYEDAFLHSK